MNNKNNLLIMALFIALLSPIIVASIDYGDRETLIADVTISNSFKIIPTAGNYYIDSINVTVSSYPVNDSKQSVLYNYVQPKEPEFNNDGTMMLSWKNPESLQYDFSIVSRVITRNDPIQIKKKSNFPITTIDSSLYKYLEPTAIIDVDPEIRDLASELSSSTDDMYEVEYGFAEYVRKNIEYDLGTLTADASQKSSWVLKNKIGVCDELTVLFISLNRASGIPARFISGLAYTNLDVFGTSWVPHAWAEVYFPGHGWIPYDVTYGQYGFIDAGHIKLSESIDARQASVKYYYVGKSLSLDPSEIKTSVDVVDYDGKAVAGYTFVTYILDSNIGFGSYDIVIVDVENPKDYYVIADLYMAETQGMQIVEDSRERVLDKIIHRKEILLRPGEKKSVYWRVLLDGQFNSKYEYTMPITVYNSYNQTSTKNIYARKGYTIIDRDYVDKYVKDKQKEQEKKYSTYISLQCTADKSSAYVNESINLSCTLDNKGDKIFDTVNICVDDDCFERELGIEKTSFSMTKKYSTVDVKNIVVSVENEQFLKSSYVTVNIIDEPAISIHDLSYPETVYFGDKYNISFIVYKDSVDAPENVKILVDGPVNSNEWAIERLDDNRPFMISSNGRSMKPGNNTYKIIITYNDIHNKNYTYEKTFSILSNADFFQNISLYLNQFIYWIENLFK